MTTFSTILRCAALLSLATLAAGCASRASASQSSEALRSLGDLRGPIVIAGGGTARGLESWPLDRGRHPNPTAIRGSAGLNPGALAANGHTVVMTSGNAIVLFDLQTRRSTTLPDPAGYAIDVAIGKSGALYVANLTQNAGNVVVYPPQGKPRELHCALLQNPDYIAVDNEGNIFINQNGSYTGVVEIPNGPNGPDAPHCTALKLHPGVSGYAAGVAIDPKTDDLLVMDDPDYCAGGIEGRLTTYSKPYLHGTGRSIVVGQNCSGTVRLDATSRIVLVGDGSVDGSYSFILAHAYPGGAFLGSFGGGNPRFFTTIPNTLPN